MFNLFDNNKNKNEKFGKNNKEKLAIDELLSDQKTQEEDSLEEELNRELEIEEEYEEDDNDELGVIGSFLDEDKQEPIAQQINNNREAYDLSSNDIEKDEEALDLNNKEETFSIESNNNNDYFADNDDDEELPIFDLKHIEEMAAKMDKKKSVSKMAKKITPKTMIFGALGIIFILLLVAALAMLLSDDTPPEEITTPIVEEPEDIIVPPENEDFEIIQIIDDGAINLVQYGEVKRVVNNKIIIRPDNSLSDTIYFITDKTASKVVDRLKLGSRIEYYYVIEDSKNIFIDFKVIYEGTVLTINENSLLLMDEVDNITEFGFIGKLKDTVSQISIDDKIEYSIENENTISSISNIIKPDTGTVIGRPDFLKDEDGTSFQLENKFVAKDWATELELIKDESINPDFLIKTTNDWEANSVKFYNSFSNPIWIRFAWKLNEYITSVPNINQVNVSLITPSGKIISAETIDEHGRMWNDGMIINYAIENPEVGEWTLKADKNIGFSLGDTNFMLMELSGFITVEKVGVNDLGNGKLDFIWSIGGVPDSNYEIKLMLTSDKYTTVIYNASSKTTSLNLVDHYEFNAKSLPKGVYDIVVEVKDLDIKTAESENRELMLENANSDSIGQTVSKIPEFVRMVTAETITHKYNAGKLTVK